MSLNYKMSIRHLNANRPVGLHQEGQLRVLVIQKRHLQILILLLLFFAIS